MAVENLRHGLKAVTGSANAPIVVGTIGKSKLAKKYKQQSKELQGKWEQYLIFTDRGKLVIMGSDKRGTIYGIYELSRQIGVSPWYWMADAPIQKHDQLFAKSGSAYGLGYMVPAILISFACYLPVTLLAKKKPAVGMLMVPKTLAYVWMLCMGLRLISIL